MSARHLSPLDLDALLVEALSPQARAELEGHLAGCPTCQEQRRAREERSTAFARSVFPRGLERLHRPRPLARRWLLTAAPAAALAVAVLVWWQGRGPERAVDGAPGIGVKGPAALRLVVRRAGAVFEIANGASLRPEDAVRFVLAPAGREFLLIASIDGAGRANVYFPYRGEASARVDPALPVEAPSGSIVLDAAPGPERVFALWSSVPLSSERIRGLLEVVGQAGPEAIRQTLTLDVPDTLQASLFFEKAGLP